MKHLQKILELSLNAINKKFLGDIGKDKTRSPYEIKIGRIDKKSKKDIGKEKDYVEIEDVSLLKKGVNLILGKKKENNKIVYSFMTKTKSNGNKHIQRITFYLTPILNSIKEKNKVTKESLLVDNDSTVYCDCDSFKYHFSNMSKKNGTYYLGSKNKNKNDYKVKGMRPSPNPRHLGGICKHIKFDIDYIEKNSGKITQDIFNYLSKEKVLDQIRKHVVDKEVDKALNQTNKAINDKEKRVNKVNSKEVDKAVNQINKEVDKDNIDVE